MPSGTDRQEKMLLYSPVPLRADQWPHPALSQHNPNIRGPIMLTRNLFCTENQMHAVYHVPSMF
jgi:hypothetical protein